MALLKMCVFGLITYHALSVISAKVTPPQFLKSNLSCLDNQACYEV